MTSIGKQQHQSCAVNHLLTGLTKHSRSQKTNSLSGKLSPFSSDFLCVLQVMLICGGVFQVCLSLGTGVYTSVDHSNFTSLKNRTKSELQLDMNSSGHRTLCWEPVLLPGHHYPFLGQFLEPCFSFPWLLSGTFSGLLRPD